MFMLRFYEAQFSFKALADNADIETAHKDRSVRIVRRIHAAPLVPGRQKRPASHGADNLSVLLVHAGDISLSGQTEPVRIHGFSGALDTGLKDIFQLFARSVEIFVIEEYHFGEEHRLLMPRLALAVHPDTEHADGSHLRKPGAPGSDGNCKR